MKFVFKRLNNRNDPYNRSLKKALDGSGKPMPKAARALVAEKRKQEASEAAKKLKGGGKNKGGRWQEKA